MHFTLIHNPNIMIKMPRFEQCISLFFIAVISVACSTPPPAKDLAQDNIIPLPTSIVATGSSYVLSAETMIYVQKGSEDLTLVGNHLAGMLNPATGFDIKVKSTEKAPFLGIYLSLSGNEKSGEAYELNIEEKLITLSASSAAGLFYGIQTLRHLLPASIEMSSVQEGQWLIATGTIKDSPSYGYRGAMLDVARHFFSVEDVKRYIDLISIYKMNALH
ncbi:MAG: hexosaminidase, partial [Cyclobacteriaceae bacterium]